MLISEIIYKSTFLFIFPITYGLIKSIVKCNEYYGLSAWDRNFSSLLPYFHKDKRGKMWARRFWFFLVLAAIDMALAMISGEIIYSSK
jgi:hypothetical protein